MQNKKQTKEYPVVLCIVNQISYDKTIMNTENNIQCVKSDGIKQCDNNKKKKSTLQGIHSVQG